MSPAQARATTDPDETIVTANEPVTEGKWCSLHLHWAGGDGQSDATEIDGGGYWKLWPSSPDGAFWFYDGPHDYEYDPDAEADQEAYERIVTFLSEYLDERECGPVLAIGYSSGGGMAAKLLCSGEDFGGRLWGVIVDDPVMDEGVLECAPSPNIRHVQFTHSTELTDEAANANGDCSVTGWYCENNRTMTLDEYEELTGYPSTLSREFHAGGGWEDTDYAAWSLEFDFWTTLFDE